MHLLKYVAKCTVTDSPFNTEASYSKCPPSVWIYFLTHVTREICNLTKHCSVVDASCSAENWLD